MVKYEIFLYYILLNHKKEKHLYIYMHGIYIKIPFPILTSKITIQVSIILDSGNKTYFTTVFYLFQWEMYRVMEGKRPRRCWISNLWAAAHFTTYHTLRV